MNIWQILLVCGACFAWTTVNAIAWIAITDQRHETFKAFEWALDSRFSPTSWVIRLGFGSDKEELPFEAVSFNLVWIAVRGLIAWILLAPFTVEVWVCLLFDGARISAKKCMQEVGPQLRDLRRNRK